MYWSEFAVIYIYLYAGTRCCAARCDGQDFTPAWYLCWRASRVVQRRADVPLKRTVLPQPEGCVYSGTLRRMSSRLWWRAKQLSGPSRPNEWLPEQKRTQPKAIRHLERGGPGRGPWAERCSSTAAAVSELEIRWCPLKVAVGTAGLMGRY